MTAKVFLSSSNEVFENLGTRENPNLVCPYGPEIYFSKIDDSLTDKLQDFAKNHKFTKQYNRALAGMIKGEYELDCDDELYNQIYNELLYHLNKMIEKYVQTNLENHNKKIKRVHLSQLWINFQKQHEFNPHHKHGGKLSFVIYIDIPKGVKEAYKKNDVDWQMNCKGLFEFRYFDTPMSISPSTGDVIIFPADLDHGVYPFDNDEIRISMSGNILGYELE